MAKSNHKKRREAFDVTEFLRPTDSDLKSALETLLGSGSATSLPADTRPSPAPLLRPGPELRPDLKASPDPSLPPEPRAISTPSVRLEPKVNDAIARADTLGADLNLEGAVNLRPGIDPTRPAALPGAQTPKADLKINPGPELRPEHKVEPETILRGGSIFTPERKLEGDLNLSPDLNLDPGPKLTPAKRKFAIREAKLAQDGHTKAEQQLYEKLWEAGKVLDETSRVITMGFGAMARLVRLSESNARLNLRSLIAKLAVEEFSGYNCEMSIGRTYRIFNYSEILKRRRKAGLCWYMKRTLAVVFVDQHTGEAVDLTEAGAKLRPGVNLEPPPGPKLEPPPGIKLRPLNREESLEKVLREEPSAPSAAIVRAISQYATLDDEAVGKLIAACRQYAPDASEEEMIHFIHEKGKLIGKAVNGAVIGNPAGFLLTAVPKCFAGASFVVFRERRRMEREMVQDSPGIDDEAWREILRQQELILQDPNASQADRQLARRLLGRDAGGL